MGPWVKQTFVYLLHSVLGVRVCSRTRDLSIRPCFSHVLKPFLQPLRQPPSCPPHFPELVLELRDVPHPCELPHQQTRKPANPQTLVNPGQPWSTLIHLGKNFSKPLVCGFLGPVVTLNGLLYLLLLANSCHPP